MHDSVLKDCFIRDFDGELLYAATTYAGNARQARLTPSKRFFHGNKAYAQVKRQKSGAGRERIKTSDWSDEECV